MGEAYTSSQQDLRTLGDQLTRLLSDLNIPALQNVAVDYLRDAMRYFARQPFFFNDTDNTTLSDWAATTNYPQGSTILTSISGTQYIIVALNTGISGAAKPTFPTTIFTVPSAPAVPPPAAGTAGTVIDNAGTNQITWATAVAFTTPSIYTQLTTVYGVNQYVPPIDWVAPKRVEVTWSGNLRMGIDARSYDELRSYDVIRPTPPTTYPTMWAWFQEQIYFWPYPVGLYPITLSYRTAPPVLLDPTLGNFWTRKGEALVRNYANYLIQKIVQHDDAAAAQALEVAERELVQLTGHRIRQENSGITPEPW